MNRFARTTIIVIVLLFSVSIFTQTTQADGKDGEPFKPNWGKITDEEWQITAPADYPEANAVIIFNVGNVEVTKDGITIDYHLRAKVLTQAGVDEASEWSFSWYDPTDKIKNFEARTITPDGKKYKVEKDAVFESEYGDWKEKKFAFPQLAPGVIVEYKYTHRSERFKYLRPWYFQNELYTLYSQVTAGVAPGFGYDVEFHNVPGKNRTAVEGKHLFAKSNALQPEFIKTFTWKMENVPPVTDEPYMGAINDYRAFVRFQLESFHNGMILTSFLRTWPEEGDDFRRFYLDDFDNATGRVKEIVTRVTNGKTTEREKSKAIFTWVTDSLATSTEPFGGWFFRENIDEMLNLHSGAGEDKNYLMYKMHDLAGIAAWPVLISTRSNGRFNPKQGDFRQFNYLITLVQMGDEWEFLDASGKYTPYGLLPPNLLTDGGLLLEGSNSDLVRITIKPANSQRYDSTMIVIDPEGAVTGNVTSLYTGYTAAELSQQQQRATPEELIDDLFADQVDAECEWGDLTFTKDTLDISTVTASFSSNELTSTLGANLVMQPVNMMFGGNPFVSKRRFFPVDFMYPFGFTNQVDIVYQGEFSEINLPPDTTFKMLGASFARVSTVKDSIATVTTQLIIEQPMFEPRLYEDLRKFFDEITLCNQDQVAFVK